MSSPSENAKKSHQHHHDDEDDDSKIFPMRLQEILNDEAHANAICWLPHGKAFVIRDRKVFAEKVMPKFFSRKAKYSSFTRKLNRWNFTRVSSGPELGAYYHQYFLRDKPHLAAQMFCKNARTKLAMANDTPMPEATANAAPVPEMAAAAPPTTAAAAERAPVTQSLQNIPLALLAAITKEPELHQQSQETRKFDFTGSSLQLLERQLQLLQEEQAQRLYMYRLAMANQTLPPVAPPQPQQAAGIQQMQQLMQMRERQRKGLVPRNGRASAA